MAQHQFLRQRALSLQSIVLESRGKRERDIERSLALYTRYQTTNERAFHKCLNDLLKLRAEKRKAEIGFESQERAEAEAARKESNQAIRQNIENRKQELHKFQVWLAEAKSEHQELLNARLETPKRAFPTASNAFSRANKPPEVLIIHLLGSHRTRGVFA